MSGMAFLPRTAPFADDDLVTLDRVKVGGIELVSIDGLVTEQDAGVALLGMSFLNRVEMRRNGDSMTLIRRF